LYKHKNLWINDVTTSMIELELSFKQIFFILLLGSKIAEAFRPVIQVVDHMGQQSLRRKQPVQPQASNLLTLQMSSIYFALIKETTDLTLKDEAIANSIPMMSLEIKSLKLEQKT
jgi:hypothetical protein